ncbi:MAG: NAD-dependent epimerase/dehydratase family protein [Paracoccus sp. (in: a-proteobacteria)]|nr:NAD-dependent epimerase/dehydratase family protein [Paracoccus sp. (in: a-proteobacteria)]
MERKILVTGGAGFIGSHLTARLTAAGDRVTVLDDLSTGNPTAVPDQARFVNGDIRDHEILNGLIADSDLVFHLAAQISVQDCITQWETSHHVNLGGTMAILRAAWRAGNVPVIYASSAAVYGDRDGICRESDMPQPMSPYAADKLGGEHQARAMAMVYGLPSVGLRFFNVYGPGQNARSPYAGVIARLCANRRAGDPHIFYGDGLQSRDFIHVADVANALICAADRMADIGGVAPVFNICTGTATSLFDLAGMIDRLTDAPPLPIRHVAPRAGDIRHSIGDPTNAEEVLGFRAGNTLPDPLGELLKATG